MEHLHLPGASLTLGLTAAASPGITNDVRTNIWSTTAASHWSVNPAAGGVPLDFAVGSRQASGFRAGILRHRHRRRGHAVFRGERPQSPEAVEPPGHPRPSGAERHDLRLGIDYQRLAPSRETAAESVMARWDSLRPSASGNPPLLVSVRAEQASALVETLSVFVQDTWSVTPRLNLTYGLRWELTPPPSMRQPSAAVASDSAPRAVPGSALAEHPMLPAGDELWKTRYTQFAPRFGAAFRAGQSSVIRAGWGIFYDVAFSTALDPINGFPFNRWQFSSGTSGRRAAVTLRPSASATPAVCGCPTRSQWNIAYERMFGIANFLSASYVGLVRAAPAAL